MKSSVRSDNSLAVLNIWSRLRTGNRLVPVFSPLDHLTFKVTIPFLAVAELDFDARKMPVKLAGSAIRQFFGFEIAGQVFLEYDISTVKPPSYVPLPDRVSGTSGRMFRD